MDEQPRDERSPVSPPRPRYRTGSWAALGAVAVALAVVAAALVINRHRPAASAGSTAGRPQQSGVNRLLHAAPCRLIDHDRHPADARKIARFPAVAVVECRTETRTYPGEGEW